MQEKYERAELETVEFPEEDVILTSGEEVITTDDPPIVEEAPLK